MGAVDQFMSHEQSGELEEAAFKEMFPFRCYRNGMTTSQDFRNLNEASEATGISEKDIAYAIEFQKGNMGGFVFVRK